MDPNMNTTLLAWQAPAHNDHERSDRWYLIAGLVAAIFIVYGLVTGAWLMSVCLGICSGLYFLVRNEKHKNHSITITKMGVEFDGVMHGWSELKDFWMLSGPGYCELHIASRKRLVGDLRIQTGDLDPFHVRDVLHHFLEQDPHKREKLLDTISRLCKL